ncbi:hypothetical protein GJ744_002777 [Endocarpon pusillum]|uniref:Calmodulin n=1 Tax=Endocarpon pusillum TaxID=364733 RepID=A0A8H7E6A9_9EURO|nr:hypothetical protein GJ744_002777 [Endocarpon pusillum]
MASTSQGHPAFPARSTYAAAGKLPDRLGLNNPPPFGSSAVSRRPDQQAQQYGQGAMGPQQQIQGGGGGRGHQHQHQQHQQSGADKEPNPLNELSEEQREEINEAFSLFDLDRDRHLDYHELRVALRALGFTLPKPELLSLLTSHGVPRSQISNPAPQNNKQPQPRDANVHPSHLLIPHSAFCTIAAQRILARDPREEIERAFDLFDAENKGYIDLEDLKRVARELGETGLEEEELRAMVEEFDVEEKGGVGREEFVGICLQG